MSVLFRGLLTPIAERDEVLADLQADIAGGRRVRASGRAPLGLAAGDPLGARARPPDLVARHDGIRAAARIGCNLEAPCLRAGSWMFDMPGGGS